MREYQEETSFHVFFEVFKRRIEIVGHPNLSLGATELRVAFGFVHWHELYDGLVVCSNENILPPDGSFNEVRELGFGILNLDMSHFDEPPAKPSQFIVYKQIPN